MLVAIRAAGLSVVKGENMKTKVEKRVIVITDDGIESQKLIEYLGEKYNLRESRYNVNYGKIENCFVDDRLPNCYSVSEGSLAITINIQQFIKA